MRFFKLSPDEIVITDGKTVVLVMARDGKLPPEAYIELEGYNTHNFCKSCERNTIFAQTRRKYDYHWSPCEDCPKEVQPR